MRGELFTIHSRVYSVNRRSITLNSNVLNMYLDEQLHCCNYTELYVNTAIEHALVNGSIYWKWPLWRNHSSWLTRFVIPYSVIMNWWSNLVIAYALIWSKIAKGNYFQKFYKAHICFHLHMTHDHQN